MNIVKIYGLRRTGTNYLQWFLINNIKQLLLLVDTFAWKHGLPKSVPDGKDLKKLLDLGSPKDYRLSHDVSKIPNLDNIKIHYGLCIKDPYSWYLSMCKWKEIDPLPVERDKLEFFFLWNYMSAEYQKFYIKNHNTFRIRYEKLLSLDIEDTVLDFFTQLGMDFNVPIVDNKYNVFSGEEFSGKRCYYINKEYLKLYRGIDFDHIRGALDKNMMEVYGYKIQ